MTHVLRLSGRVSRSIIWPRTWKAVFFKRWIQNHSGCQKRPTHLDSSPSILVQRRLDSWASCRPSLPTASAVIYYSIWKGEPLRRIEIFRESLGKEKKRRISIPERREGRVASEYRNFYLKVCHSYQENHSLSVDSKTWETH